MPHKLHKNTELKIRNGTRLNDQRNNLKKIKFGHHFYTFAKTDIKNDFIVA